MATPHIQRPHGWRKWMCLIGGPAFVLLGVAVLLGGILSEPPDLGLIWLGGCVTALFGSAAIYYWLLVQRFQLRVYDDAIEAAFVFRTRRVERGDITGWIPGKADDLWHNSVNLQIRGGPKTVEMPIIVTDDPVVQRWFEDIPNLQAQAQDASLEAVLADQQFGHTAEERLATINRERRIGGALTIVGFAVAGWVIFWPQPYVVAVSVAALLPVLALVLTALLQQRWGLGQRKPEDQRPEVDNLFVMPILALLMRAFADSRTIDHAHLMLIALGFAVLGWLVAAMLSGKGLDPTGRNIVFAIGFTFYGYAVASIVNVQADTSPGRRFDVEVIASSSSDGASSITLAPWGPSTSPQSTSVPAWFQGRAPVGSKVRVDLYSGRLGARWWVLHEPAAAD